MISYFLSPLFFIGEASSFEKKKKDNNNNNKKKHEHNGLSSSKVWISFSLFFFQSAYTLFQF